MDRSNYPPKVEVRSADLGGTERTKAFHILKRFLDTGQPGIISGLTVQQSSVGLDRFDLLLGYGYAPNGELTELTATLEGQSVGALPGVPALAGLMYREVAQRAGAAETGGIALDRETVRSSEIRVFTADQWSALPTTFDDDLSVDAQDRFLVCGIVTKPTVDGDPLEIVLPPSWDLIKTIEQTSITGIFITAIDPDTEDTDPFPQTGAEDLATFVYQPSSTSLAYKAPHDTVDLGQASPFNVVGMGVPVDVSAGGTFTLTSANGTNTVAVVVDPAMLPSVTVLSQSSSVSVSTLYYPTAARGSGRDDLHRHQLGSLVPAATNPHGLRWSDLQTLLEEVLGTLSVGTRYTTLTTGEVPRLRIPANPGINHATELRVSELLESEGSNTARFNNLPVRVRVYRNSREGLMLCYNFRIRNSGANGTFERLTTNGDDPDLAAAAIEINTTGVTLLVQPAASPDTWTDVTWAAPTIGAMYSFISGLLGLSGGLSIGGTFTATGAAVLTQFLILGSALLTGDSDTQIPRLTRNFQDDGTVIRTLLEISAGTTAQGDLRVYRALFSNPGGLFHTIEFAHNAVWDEVADTWSSDDITLDSWRLVFGRRGMMLHRRAAGVGSWVDNAWTDGVVLDDTGVSILAAKNYQWATARTFTKSIPGLAGLSDNIGAQIFYTSVSHSPEAATTGYAGVQKAGAPAVAVVTWPAELPNGARVIGVRVHAVNIVPVAYVRGAMVRQDHAGAALPESLKTGVTPYNDIVSGVTVLDIDEPGAWTIDNAGYSYYVWIGFDVNSTGGIVSVEIDYTLTQVELP